MRKLVKKYLITLSVAGFILLSNLFISNTYRLQSYLLRYYEKNNFFENALLHKQCFQTAHNSICCRFYFIIKSFSCRMFGYFLSSISKAGDVACCNEIPNESKLLHYLRRYLKYISASKLLTSLL